jgi:glyceraldehyde 3-phosphate dehydrogenase
VMTNNIVGNGKLGLNGLGRIGKLALWYNIATKNYEKIFVNVGREIGESLDTLLHYVSSDSTYGKLNRFLGGFNGPEVIEVVNRDDYEVNVDGVTVSFLTKERNPKDIPWRKNEVRLVIDCTGRFTDPTLPADTKGGSLSGHLAAGATVAINSSAFKIKDKGAPLPEQAVTLMQGINHQAFEPAKHRLISSASCTTTALAHMIKPLIESTLTNRMLTAAMTTIHAATNTQAVLDRAPAAGASDHRKTRSILDNIILTSTNAARALELVVPEIKRIGFLADSIRVPLKTGSVVILNCTFQSQMDDHGKPSITRDSINGLYKDYALAPDSGIKFSEVQNVSGDIVGEPSAVVIEGLETHTRTGFIDVDLTNLVEGQSSVSIPVTHAKIFGWYDNELGSYTRRMSQLAAYIGDRIS